MPCRWHLEVNALRNDKAVALDPDDFSRIIGKNTDGAKALIGQDLCPDAVFTKVGFKTQS